MIRIICNNFNFETMENNIGFVFTKYYGESEKIKKKIKKSKEEEVRKCEKIIEKFFNKKLKDK